MTLEPGTSFAHYEIDGEIGRGGMGVVYLARDTRLNRTVAIKTLPAELLSDSDRLTRFEREAQLLASLNHANIAAIYGLEESAYGRCLVLEYVKGTTLADRLRSNALRVDEATRLSIQIAKALEAAHGEGIIHRDLKPENIMITEKGDIKVLDFGLARRHQPAAEEDTLPHPSASYPSDLDLDKDTVASPAPSGSRTTDSVIVGTVGYMSPEQVRGQPIDKRADIFAFGCVLYEMLTRRQPFGGNTMRDKISYTLNREPSWSALPSHTPEPIRRLLARCLCKDREHRLHDIADARIELESPFDSQPTARPKTGWLLPAVFGILLGCAVMLGIRSYVAPPLEPKRVTRFTLRDFGLSLDSFQGLAISPDGNWLAYTAIDQSRRRSIRLQSLETGESHSIPHSEGCFTPFFSADSSRLGFRRGEMLLYASVESRNPVKIENVGPFSGATWMSNGDVIFASDDFDGFGRVSLEGEIERLEVVGANAKGWRFSYPSLLPDEQALLCTAYDGEVYRLGVFELASRELSLLAENCVAPAFDNRGYVVFQRGLTGNLMALPFDAGQRVATGDPIVIADDILAHPFDHLEFQTFALSGTGTLAYIPTTVGVPKIEMCWISQSGEATAITQLTKQARQPRVSRDGRRIAYRESVEHCRIWVYDVKRDAELLVADDKDNHGHAWSADGQQVLFASNTSDYCEVMMGLRDASAPPRRFSPAKLPRGFLTSISRDGEHALVGAERDGISLDVFAISPGSRARKVLLGAPFDERQATLCPNGEFIAYVANEEGKDHVYVRSFPELSNRLKVSIVGGSEPVWSKDGEKLYFRFQQRIMVADFDPTSQEVSAPRTLFETDADPGSRNATNFDVATDGRFVMFRRTLTRSSLNMVINWPVDR